MKPKVFLVGHAAQDYIFALPELPAEPVKYHAESLTYAGGGLSANAAVTVVRLGGEAVLATRIGDDLVGGEIEKELRQAGVDCAYLRRFKSRQSPLSMVVVDRRGERLIVNYTDDDIPDEVSWLPKALPAGVGAVMGDVRWPKGGAHIFALARSANVPAVLDGDRGFSDTALTRDASHIVYSAQALREQGASGDLKSALAALARKSKACLAVTDGRNGTWFTEGAAIRHCPAFAVEVVDTLAAGDVFHGALALALAEAMPLARAFRFASAAAAVKCTRFGGRKVIPQRAEVEALMQQAGEHG